MTEKNSNKAFLYLIKLLSSRDYSEHKLREKLRTRQYPENEIEDAIKMVKDKNYLREDVYSEARIKAFMNKGYSQDFIRQKLNAERVKVEIPFIDSIYNEYHHSEDDQIKRLLEKKLRGKPIIDYNHETKLIRFVLSKGHDLSATKKILKQIKDELATS